MTVRMLLLGLLALPACLLKPGPPGNGTGDAGVTDAGGPKDSRGGSGSGSGSDGSGSGGSGSVDMTPRLISYAFYSATGASGSSMSSTAYSINIQNVNDGDLVVLFASFNGSVDTFTVPASLTKLYDMQYGGSDGQTFVVATGTFTGTGTTYTGTYGSGAGTPSIAMQLVAISGASAVTPIDLHDLYFGALPEVQVTGPGDMTTASNCQILVAAGVDWTTAGTVVPEFSAPLTEVGTDTDQGSNGVTSFTRTSLTVGRFETPVTGALGSNSLTLTSIDTGAAWGVVIGIAPK